jgi:hypothetical protein
MQMRRYDDPVEVRAGLVDGREAPAQFLWRDRLWQVREVVGHWVETAPWWHQPEVQGLLGGHDAERPDTRPAPASAGSVASLVAERDVWRVDASKGRLGPRGVVELVHDGITGQWRLTGCED